jgi:hypothetical protein
MDVASWSAVIVLVVLHLLAERGRINRHSAAFRTGAGVAASLVIASAAMAGVWPAAALGLLWLRAEVLGHDDRQVPGLVMPSVAHTMEHRAKVFILRVWRPVMLTLLRMELVVVLIVALVLAGLWMEQQRSSYYSDSNAGLCRLMRRC